MKPQVYRIAPGKWAVFHHSHTRHGLSSTPTTALFHSWSEAIHYALNWW